MAAPTGGKVTSCLKLLKCLNTHFHRSQTNFGSMVARSRHLHTSPCRLMRTYNFISPYPRDEPIKDEPRTEVVESKEDFKYVERLLPPTQIPPVPDHAQYPTPSGWSPPRGAAPGTLYNVSRTRFHNVPVFIETKHSNQHWTLVKNITGDIWALAEELKSHLDEEEGREIPVTVNEFAMRIRYKGLHEDKVMQWLVEKGF